MPQRPSCPTAALFENAVSHPHGLHGVSVGPDAALLEDALVGPNATLLEDALVGPNATLLEDALVGPNATLLEDKFPHDARVLHLLKLADAHFCSLAARYHALNRAIHRVECEVERVSDLYLARLKRQRLTLLDEIALMIEDAEMRFALAEAEQRHERRRLHLPHGAEFV